MKIMLLLCMVVSIPVFGAIVLDVKNLEESLKTNPDDIEMRLLLASYYLNSGDLKAANRHITDALKQDVTNGVAQNLKKEWKEIKSDRKLLSSLNITDLNKSEFVDKSIKSLYVSEKNKLLDQLFIVLEKNRFELNENSRIVYVARLVDQANYEKAKKILDEMPNKNSIDHQKLLSITCLKIKDMNCAVSNLNELYDYSNDPDIGMALAGALTQQGRVIDAKHVIEKNEIKVNDNPEFVALEEEINKQLIVRSENAKKHFQNNQSANNVKKYASSLIDSGDRKKSYEVLLKYIARHPTSDNVRIFASKQYALEREYSPAIDLLRSLRTKTPMTQVLLARYSVWSGDRTGQAKSILVELLKGYKGNHKRGLDSNTYYRNAVLLLSNIYLGEQKNSEALKYISPFAKKYPHDKELEEIYLLATKDYKSLIKKIKSDLKDYPLNPEIVLKLARAYLMTGDKSESLKYYERYHSLNPTDTRIEKDMGLLYLSQKKFDLGFKYLKRNAYRDHSEEELMNLAKNYHWNGFNLKALRVISEVQKYYPESREPIKLKTNIFKAPLNNRNDDVIKAAKAYENANYKAAIPLYRKYLEQYPNDSFTRNRYAYALSQIGSYATAADEFGKLLEISPDDLKIRYHLAYNKEKTDDIETAKKIYRSIIKKTNISDKNDIAYKEKINSSSEKLYMLAMARLEFIENNKDTVVNGLYLSGGVKKTHSPEKDVLNSAIVTIDKRVDSKSKLSLVQEDVLYNTREDLAKVETEYVRTSDSEGIKYNDSSIRFHKEFWPGVMELSYERFNFSDSVCKKAIGGTGKILGQINKSTRLSLGGGVRVDDLNGVSKYSPFLTSQLSFDNSHINLGVYKRPLFYEKLSCTPLINNTTKSGINIYGNVDFDDNRSLVYSIDAGYINDDNIEFIPQFNYTFYKDSLKSNYVPIDYELSVEGYYLWDKLQTDDYYSPSLFDSTSGSLLSMAHINESIDLIADVAMGYSMDSDNILFRYGLSVEYSINDKTHARASCERSNIGSTNAGEQDYQQDNCIATLEIQWK